MTFSEHITVVSHISRAGSSKLLRLSSSVSVRMLQFMQKVHNALLRRASSRTNLLVSRAFASAASGSLDSERNNGSKVQAWIDTLDPLLKRKIQYIQNEVSISLHVTWHFFGSHHFHSICSCVHSGSSAVFRQRVSYRCRYTDCNRLSNAAHQVQQGSSPSLQLFVQKSACGKREECKLCQSISTDIPLECH